MVPLAENAAPDVQIQSRDGLISLVTRDAPLSDVLAIIGQTQQLNIVSSDDATTRVSVTLHRVRLEDALSSLVSIAGYQWAQHGGIIHVTPIANANHLPPQVQGRRVQVFSLDYASPLELQAAVQGMLSPAGRAFLMQSDSSDNRQSQDSIAVEDLPAYVERIGQYIQQVDQPPRQVLIEAHILEVELRDDERWGINWDYLLKYSGNSTTFQLKGLADPLAPQAFFINVDGDRFNALMECLQSTEDAKALASPKVMVINGQQARIQIGDKLGYRVTTVTETSALESVDFLDVGVVLTVVPRISRDGHILINVKPEVSGGSINPDTQLPEEETTEVQTDVLLRDGQGMVIGGLIQEQDRNTQSKIPFIGDIKFVGKLFQKRSMEKKRSEIIVALMPRILPYDSDYQQLASDELFRAQTPLFYGPLIPTPRPWEPMLPDTIYNPACLCAPRPKCPHGQGGDGTPCAHCAHEEPILRLPPSVGGSLRDPQPDGESGLSPLPPAVFHLPVPHPGAMPAAP
jgi:type II secretory pathway component GspD/PulD (secretin)